MEGRRSVDLRLTRLEIFGFKSFARKVSIPFGPGITAIVGPNGCGKSNVVEAIRWVLGEQRSSTFRSHRMEDVIFAGTRERKQLGLAEVSLTIENTNHVLPVQFSEVTLARRLLRSGDSDYLLNKAPCRLLDIHNLLMDTGLGQGAYAVMEQGMVDEIISEKTENRRRILEEAAGITKYKVRRRSTWNSLESTNADLNRIEDIIAEVKRQVGYLGRQVGRARRYRQIKEELDQLEVVLGRFRFFASGEELRPKKGELARLSSQVEAAKTRFRVLEAELEKPRLDRTDAQDDLAKIGSELTRCIEEIGEREGSLRVVDGRIQAARQTVERAGRERQDCKRDLETCMERQQEAARQVEAASQDLGSLDQRLGEARRDADCSEEVYSHCRNELNAHNADLVKVLGSQKDTSLRFERLRTTEESLVSREEQLQRESREVAASIGEQQEQVRQAGARGQSLEGRLRELEGRSRTLQERADEVEARFSKLHRDSEELGRAIEANQARLEVMEKVRSGYVGYAGGVRTLLLESPYADLFQGVLADLVEVDPACQCALETAIGESLQGLVASSAGAALDAVRYLKDHSGRALIFPLELSAAPVAPPVALAPAPGLLGPLLDRVRCRESVAVLVSHLLHNTFLVEDLDTALELTRPHAERGVRFVTLEGDAIDVCGRVVGGKSGADASLLGRRREIRNLKGVLASQQARLAALESTLEGEERRRTVVARRFEAVSRELDDLVTRKRDHAHRVEVHRSALRELQSRLEHLDAESDDLQDRRRNLQTSIQAQSEQLKSVEMEIEDLQGKTAACGERLQVAEDERRKKQDRLSSLRVDQVAVAEKVEGLRRESGHQSSMEQTLRQNIGRLEEAAAQAEGQLREGRVEKEEISAELKVMHERRDALERDKDRAWERWQESDEKTSRLEKEIGAIQREVQDRGESRHQLELQVAELEGMADRIRERLLEEQNCDVEVLGPVDSADFDPVRSEERVGELRRSLQRLGAVHVGVLEEYEEQKERYDFLCGQRDDLREAAEDLKKTLSLIDRRARRIFRDTFEQIREKFKETFLRFFPGGEADLLLQADADPLEAFIDIVARPRGKRPQSIDLLSGGEKALTAIALLFALYLVKPSPFCILDEVDAPLDDTNIGRFVSVIKEFARTTQFIMVTHNKLSMHAADTLHGVTMPEEGVSQLVSVQLESDDILVEAAG